MKKVRTLLFIAILSLFSIRAYADEKISCAEVVRIGCTVGCDLKIRTAIQSLLPKKVNVKYINLFKNQNLLETVDGILSPGGKDIQLKYYSNHFSKDEFLEAKALDFEKGKHTEFSSLRDEFEMNLWKQYFEKDELYSDVAALGVCYGHQMMAITHGFALYQDIKTQLGISSRYDVKDWIVSEEGVPSFFAHEEHHQSVRRSPFIKDAIVTATSNSGKIIERIRYSHRKAHSVQFHPELSDLSIQRLIFRPFLKVACAHSLSKNTR